MTATAAAEPRTGHRSARLRRPGRRVRRAVAVAVPGVVGLLALTACGGEADAAAPALPSASAPAGGASAAAPTPERTGMPSEEDVDRAWDDYRACMADFGVEVDAGQDELVVPSVGDPGVTEEALDECEPILEDIFGGFELSPEEEAELRESQLAFAQCMRDNGYPDFPDPGTAAAEAATPPPGLDVDSPEFEETSESCLEESYGDLENFELETQETGS